MSNGINPHSEAAEASRRAAESATEAANAARIWYRESLEFWRVLAAAVHDRGVQITRNPTPNGDRLSWWANWAQIVSAVPIVIAVVVLLLGRFWKIPTWIDDFDRRFQTLPTSADLATLRATTTTELERLHRLLVALNRLEPYRRRLTVLLSAPTADLQEPEAYKELYAETLKLGGSRGELDQLRDSLGEDFDGVIGASVPAAYRAEFLEAVGGDTTLVQDAKALLAKHLKVGKQITPAALDLDEEPKKKDH